jgi:TetR/AcrR family transcriptional regulator
MVQRYIPEADGETKSLILDAAVMEFGESGFHGARIDSIAKRSGINKAMIYYHFKGKNELYAAIIERLFEEILGKVMTMARTEMPPETRLATMVETLGSFIGDMNDSMRKLLLWEIASGGSAFQKIIAPKFFKKVFPIIKDIYGDGVSKGVFRKDISPVFTQMSIVG